MNTGGVEQQRLKEEVGWLAGWLAEVNVDKHHKSWKKSIEQQLQLKEN